MSGEIVRQSDPMKELFFSFLPMVKHSRGHKRFAVLLVVLLVLASQFAVFRLVPNVKAKNVYQFTHVDAKVINPDGNLVLYGWDKEASLAIGLPFGVILNTEFEVLSDKEGVLFDGGVARARIYKLDEESVEFDVVLEKNIAIYEFVFPISSQNLVFYYQPPLYEEYGFFSPFSNSTFSVNATDVVENGIVVSHRPEDVVGSYAVYHNSKRNNEYKTGKAFHIYRPLAVDSVGNKVWCDLNIDEAKGILSITISQTFLDSAVYPVSIDPSFGYTTAGASNYYIYHMIAGSVFPIPQSGTADSITVDFFSFGAGKAKTAIYQHSDSTLVKASGELSAAGSGWKTFTLPDPKPTLTASTEYVLVAWASATYTRIRYDTGDTNQGHYKDVTYNGFPNPISFNHANYKFSIYCNYTVVTNYPSIDSLRLSSISDTTNISSITVNTWYDWKSTSQTQTR